MPSKNKIINNWCRENETDTYSKHTRYVIRQINKIYEGTIVKNKMKAYYW